MNLKQPRWHDVLLAIYRQKEDHRYSTRLNRYLKGSLTHLRIIVKRLERNGLIRILPQKNKKNIILTDKGERIAQAVMHIREELKTQLFDI